MSNLGVTNGYIYDLLKNKIRLPMFEDVYAANTVKVSKLRKRKQFIFIVNLSPSGAAGTHFVCIVKRGRRLHYIDSLAMPSNTSRILWERLKLFNMPIIEAYKSPIQHQSSIFCGLYCVYFACLNDRDAMPNSSGLKPFSNKTADLMRNDSICVANIKRLIRNNLIYRR